MSFRLASNGVGLGMDGIEHALLTPRQLPILNLNILSQPGQPLRDVEAVELAFHLLDVVGGRRRAITAKSPSRVARESSLI